VDLLVSKVLHESLANCLYVCFHFTWEYSPTVAVCWPDINVCRPAWVVIWFLFALFLFFLFFTLKKEYVFKRTDVR